MRVTDTDIASLGTKAVRWRRQPIGSGVICHGSSASTKTRQPSSVSHEYDIGAIPGMMATTSLTEYGRRAAYDQSRR